MDQTLIVLALVFFFYWMLAIVLDEVTKPNEPPA